MTENNKPKIVVEGKALPAIVSEAEYCLMASDLSQEIYQRDGSLVRIGKFPVHGRADDYQFVGIVKETLVEMFTYAISWQQVHVKKEKVEYREVMCPTWVATTYLGRNGKWNVPTIRAIITAPTLRPDNSLLDQPGYDTNTGLFFVPQEGVEFPQIPEKPTKEQARACLDFIISMVEEVPFVQDEKHGHVNRSVFLSAFLSALIRPTLPQAPMHGFTSPSPGTGKSMLVNGITLVMTGNPVAPVTQGGEEETAKVLSSALQSGMLVISFDNCEHPLGGAMLCQAVSEPELSVRIFGKTELKKITNAAMYFATGNNLTFTGDIVRRAIRCTIDAQCERPEDRDFTTQQPDEAMFENRADLVAAGLTVLRAFVCAGMPKKVKDVGTFKKWSRLIRNCLIWLGEPDPWFSTESIREEDPQIANNVAALHAWFEVFSEKKMTTKDVVDTIDEQRDGMHGKLRVYTNSKLRDALSAVTDDDPTSQKIGTWLSGIKHRPIGGYVVTPATKMDGNNRWQVLVAAKTTGKTTENSDNDPNLHAFLKR